MAEAKRDQNSVPTLLAVSNVDGSTPVVIYADPVTHRLLVDLPSSGGNVVGPVSSTDNAIVRFDGTTGALIQDSGITIDDVNLMNIPGTGKLNFGNAGTVVYVDESGGMRLHGDATHPINITDGASTVRSLIGVGSNTDTYFNTGGSFGIGTASPGTKLHVLGTTSTPMFLDSSATQSFVNFRLSNVSKGYIGYTTLGSTGLALLNSTGSVANLLVTEAGNVGVSNSSPGEVLTIGTAGTTAGTLSLAGATSGKVIVAVPAVAGSGTLTLPVATDTLVGKATTDILTNKTLTSPTLTTPVLGTPSSGTLTSCTGLPISTGVSGLGTGVATFLATPSSANLASAITDETGSGALVFGTNPTIAKPVVNARNQTAQTYTPSAAATATLDLSLADQHYITMPAGNITVALSNDTNNQVFIVSVTQDATGSRTVTWFTTIKWAGGVAPTLTTTASKRDTFGFIRTGSGTYDGYVIGQNI